MQDDFYNAVFLKCKDLLKEGKYKELLAYVSPENKTQNVFFGIDMCKAQALCTLSSQDKEKEYEYLQEVLSLLEGYSFREVDSFSLNYTKAYALYKLGYLASALAFLKRAKKLYTQDEREVLYTDMLAMEQDILNTNFQENVISFESRVETFVERLYKNKELYTILKTNFKKGRALLDKILQDLLVNIDYSISFKDKDVLIELDFSMQKEKLYVIYYLITYINNFRLEQKDFNYLICIDKKTNSCTQDEKDIFDNTVYYALKFLSNNTFSLQIYSSLFNTEDEEAEVLLCNKIFDYVLSKIEPLNFFFYIKDFSFAHNLTKDMALLKDFSLLTFKPVSLDKIVYEDFISYTDESLEIKERRDGLSGNTLFYDLIVAFYKEDNSIYDYLLKMGVSSFYLEIEKDKDLNLKHLESLFTDKNDFCFYLGSAHNKNFVYFDFLAVNFESSIQHIKDILSTQYIYNFNIYPFFKDSRSIKNLGCSIGSSFKNNC